MKYLKIIIYSSCLFVMSSCSQQGLKQLLQEKSKYEAYLDKLKKADLDKTVIGQEWIMSGETVLESSVNINVPYKETGYFTDSKVQAFGYRFRLERGRSMQVAVSWENQGQLFVDLFQIAEDKVKLISSTDSIHVFSYEAEEEGEYLLRLQPEILAGGKFKLEIIYQQTLAFPILGKDSRAIGSFFGAQRDGGKRKHEGVDIFAPRKTPVIAIVNGRVSNVQTNKLGGKVIFLNDQRRKQSYYYAHLDSQLVEPGEAVHLGDTIGLIGNTGNAKHTPAHLHFGIYPWYERVLDPLPFLDRGKVQFGQESGNEKLLTEGAITIGKKTTFIKNVLASTTETEVLPEKTIVEVVGLTGKFYRVRLPDKKVGYIKVGNISSFKASEKQLSIKELPLYTSFLSRETPLLVVPKGAEVMVIGEYNDMKLVKYEEIEGWVEKRFLNG